MPLQRERASQVQVLAAMSGGVDSSMGAALLHDQGFEVVGAMMRFWEDDRADGQFSLCCSPQAAYDARRVADEIGLPFYLFDYREAFDEVVIQPFLELYQQGETPNPCVHCNRQIKFGGFLKKAKMLGCDYVATGHYVRRVDTPEGVELHRGRDDSKDQTYFLWALDQDALQHLLFPLGELTKDEVREMAEARGFATAHKKSSHSLCFITSSVKDFLKERTARNPGPILDAAQDYQEIGQHDGVQFYTVGQKKGLGLYHSHLERFVLDIRASENTLVVGTREMCYMDTLEADRMNLLTDAEKLPERVMAQTRYRQRPVSARLELLSEDRFRLHFDEPVFAITIGQSAVIYEGDRLLGGGRICSRG